MKKNIFTLLLLSVFQISYAQISIKSCPFSIIKTTAPNGTFTINLKIKNKGPSKNSGTFKFYWPEIANITIFPWQTPGTFKNDTLTLLLQSFFPLNNGETTYLIDGSFEQYIGVPEYAEFNGEKISKTVAKIIHLIGCFTLCNLMWTLAILSHLELYIWVKPV